MQSENIDAKGKNVAQPIWLSGAPTKGHFSAKSDQNLTLGSGIFGLNPEEPILFINLNIFTCDSTKVSFFRYLILIFHLNWGYVFLSKVKGGVHCHNSNIVVKLFVMILFMYFDISNLIRSNNFEITNSEFDTTFLLMNKGIKKRKQTKKGPIFRKWINHNLDCLRESKSSAVILT